jgi:hypothetical protein
MFEKIGRAAEQVASGAGVSRRGFLGGLGRAALVTVGALTGLLVRPGVAPARGGTQTQYLCRYVRADGRFCGGYYECGGCKPTKGFCGLYSQTPVGTC